MRCVWELGVQYLIVLRLPYEMFPLAKTLYVFFCCGAEVCVGVGGSYDDMRVSLFALE